MNETHHKVIVLDWTGEVEATFMAYTTLQEAIEMRKERRMAYSAAYVVLLLEVGLDIQGDTATETWCKVKF